jgi:tetratricopeptide (TPR) repeat protein
MKKKYSSTFVLFIVIILSLSITSNFILPTAHAGILYTTKIYANKVMFWKNNHLRSIGFKDLYPKAIYKKSYFSWIILGTTIIAGSAITYFSLGAGAPAAATGVGTVASWIGGGGAGSYMAGLSTVGGLFSGNAITGAVILNGLSYGLIGGTMGKFATLSAAAKFGVIANVTATMMDGIAVLENPETGELYYTVRLTLPKNLGGKQVRDLVDQLYENKEAITDALNDKDEFKAERFKKIEELNLLEGEKLLEKILKSSDPSQEDLLVLCILCYEKGNVDLFQKALGKLSVYKNDLDNTGYLEYLEGISYLLERNPILALKSLEKSIHQNPYALEPITLYINILGNDLSQNEHEMLEKLEFAEENYDSDKYVGSYSLLAPYFRMGTIYYNNQRYTKAKEFFEKAEGEIGFIQGFFGADDIENQVSLGIANCYYKTGETDKAQEIYLEILEDVDEGKKKDFQMQYAGNQ